MFHYGWQHIQTTTSNGHSHQWRGSLWSERHSSWWTDGWFLEDENLGEDWWTVFACSFQWCTSLWSETYSWWLTDGWFLADEDFLGRLMDSFCMLILVFARSFQWCASLWSETHSWWLTDGGFLADEDFLGRLMDSFGMLISVMCNFPYGINKVVLCCVVLYSLWSNTHDDWLAADSSQTRILGKVDGRFWHAHFSDM